MEKDHEDHILNDSISQHKAEEAQADYESGYQDGWEECKIRMIKILERFPMQTAILTMHLKNLHPSQPLTELGEKFE